MYVKKGESYEDALSRSIKRCKIAGGLTVLLYVIGLIVYVVLNTKGVL